MFVLREAIAGAPEGLVASVDYETKKDLAEEFRGEKYYCQEFKDWCLSENVAHYYADNQNLLKSYVPEHRMVDAVVCIMMRKGNPRFTKYKANRFFMNWCREVSKLEK